ncbi:LGFP repeat-containing protein [uncultured Sphingomonas sp.]|uniref:LGFP repeat-containing protein n=1 Tax=uncultured Sphingomonas sp. TaxID=158754 RepID=UPI0035CB06C6
MIVVLVASLAMGRPVGAYQVYGEIGNKWRALGASAGPLGVPTSDEGPAADGGRINSFKNGFVTWHPKFGAHATWGLIGAKWNQLGREISLGFPVTDEMPGANGGRFSDFSNNATIDFLPKTGTHVIIGLIRAKWLATGREGGSCGYPTSDEVAVTGGRRSSFQFGTISWMTGARAAVAQCTGPVRIDTGTALNPVKE